MMAINVSSGRVHHPLHIIKTLGEGMHGKVTLAVDPASGKKVITELALLKYSTVKCVTNHCLL
jgi:serine/threonine protein kinase